MRCGLALLSGFAALALLTVAACRSPRVTNENPMPNNDDIKVTWSLSKAGSSLEVRYAVENRSASLLYVLDQLVIPHSGRYTVLADRGIVQRGTKPHSVKFSRGFVRAASQEPAVEQGENNPLVPAARPLAAGARLEGSFHVPLPIAPWHPTLDMAPLASPERAVLELGYLSGEPAWSELPTEGGVVRVPTLAWAAKQKWALGDDKPLP